MAEATEETTQPKKRGRKKKGDISEMTNADFQNELEKLEKKKMQLRINQAKKENPALVEALDSIQKFATEATKSSLALEAGADVSVEKDKEALDKKITLYEKKIADLKEMKNNLDSGAVKQRYEELHAENVEKLKNAVENYSDDFESAGLSVTEIIPDLEPFLK